MDEAIEDLSLEDGSDYTQEMAEDLAVPHAKFVRGPGGILSLEALRGMSQMEAKDAVDKVFNFPQGTTDRIHYMETRRGSHPTMLGAVQPDGDRAMGHLQIMGKTHKEIERRYGETLNRMEWQDSIVAYAMIMEENYNKFKTPYETVAAYYAGWDKANWGPKTKDYATTAIGGGPMEDPTNDPTNTGPLRKSDELDKWRPLPLVEYANMTVDDLHSLNAEVGPRAPKFRRTYPGPKTPGPLAKWIGEPRDMAVPMDRMDAFNDAAEESRMALEKEAKAARDQPFISFDKGSFGLSRDSVMGALSSDLNRNFNATVQYALGPMVYGPDKKFLEQMAEHPFKHEEGYTDEERLHIRGAINTQDLINQKFRIQTEREDAITINRLNAAEVFLYGSIMSLGSPVDVAAGFAAPLAMAKVGLGAGPAIKAGRKFAAGARLVGEGSLNELGVELANAAMGQQVSAGDAAMAATMGAMLGTLGLPGTMAGINKARAKAQEGAAKALQAGTAAAQGGSTPQGPTGPSKGSQGPSGANAVGVTIKYVDDASGRPLGTGYMNVPIYETVEGPNGTMITRVRGTGHPVAATTPSQGQNAPKILALRREIRALQKERAKAVSNKENKAVIDGYTKQIGEAEGKIDSLKAGTEQPATQHVTAGTAVQYVSQGTTEPKSLDVLLQEAQEADTDVTRKYQKYRELLNGRGDQAAVDAAQDAHKAAKARAEATVTAYVEAKALADAAPGAQSAPAFPVRATIDSLSDAIEKLRPRIKAAHKAKDHALVVSLQEQLLSMSDYMTSLGADSRTYPQDRFIRNVLNDAYRLKERKAGYIEQAVLNLGDQATIEQVVIEADKLEAKDILAEAAERTAPIPIENRNGTPGATEAAIDAAVNPPPKPAEGAAPKPKEETPVEELVTGRHPDIDQIAARVDPALDLVAAAEALDAEANPPDTTAPGAAVEAPVASEEEVLDRLLEAVLIAQTEVNRADTTQKMHTSADDAPLNEHMENTLSEARKKLADAEFILDVFLEQKKHALKARDNLELAETILKDAQERKALSKDDTPANKARRTKEVKAAKAEVAKAKAEVEATKEAYEALVEHHRAPNRADPDGRVDPTMDGGTIARPLPMHRTPRRGSLYRRVKDWFADLFYDEHDAINDYIKENEARAELVQKLYDEGGQEAVNKYYIERNAAADKQKAEADKLRAEIQERAKRAAKARAAYMNSRDVKNDPEHEALVAEHGSRVGDNADSPDYLAALTELALATPEGRKQITELTDGDHTPESMSALAPGLHVTKKMQKEIDRKNGTTIAVRVIESLVKTFLPGRRVLLAVGGLDMPNQAGGHSFNTSDYVILGLDPTIDGTQAVWYAIHEVGHAVFIQWGQHVPKEILAAVRKDWLKFAQEYNKNPTRDNLTPRFSIFAQGNVNHPGELDMGYRLSKEEYKAEQFVKYMVNRAKEGNLGNDLGVVSRAIRAVTDLVEYVLEMVRHGFLKPDKGVEDFIGWVLDNAATHPSSHEGSGRPLGGSTSPSTAQGSTTPQGTPSGASTGPLPVHQMRVYKPRTSKEAWKDIQKSYGADIMPEENPSEQAFKIAVTDVLILGEAFDKKNPQNAEYMKRIDTITANALFNFATPATNLARSSHPVSRMFAGTVAEHTMGAMGRHITAAIQAHQFNREFIGNSFIEYDSYYGQWKATRVSALQGLVSDLSDMKLLIEFDDAVALCIENRAKEVREKGSGVLWTSLKNLTAEEVAVNRAADTMQGAYTRMKDAQVLYQTLGYKRLAKTTYGHMPHMMSPGKFLEATPEVLRYWHSALVDQMGSWNNMDLAFANKIASRYLDHARSMAARGEHIPGEINSEEGAQWLIYMALNDSHLGLSTEQATAWAEMMKEAAPGHAKGRLTLDMTKVFTRDDGSTYTLLDFFDTDHKAMLKAQAKRVAGEVALENQGIHGMLGLAVYRKAIEHRKVPNPVETARDLDAYDQICAEILGRPWGEHMPKMLEGLMSLNAQARLGNMALPQLSESLSAILAMGLQNGFASIGNLPRMMAQVRLLAKGHILRPEDNPWLGTLEGFTGGGEFGTEGYKTILVTDSHASVYDTVGKASLGPVTRLLRRTGYAMGVVTFQRILHAAQRRGVAEQIAKRALRFIKEGTNDINLADMGFNEEFCQRFRKEIARAEKLSPEGEMIGFDFGKVWNHRLVAQFKVAVDRGAHQIIQGAFIGEQGPWLHNNIGRMLSQFQHFSMLSVEKQWGRQRALHGGYKLVFMALCLAPLAIPIYLTRLAINALGRPDADEYLEKGTSPIALARGLLNYIGIMGLGPTLLDGITAMMPSSVTKDLGLQNRLGGPPTVGDIFAPLGFFDSGVKGIKDIIEGNGVHSALQTMPFSNTPWLGPAVNTTRKEY